VSLFEVPPRKLPGRYSRSKPPLRVCSLKKFHLFHPPVITVARFPPSPPVFLFRHCPPFFSLFMRSVRLHHRSSSMFSTFHKPHKPRDLLPPIIQLV